jgi:2,3-bisphosphoglycerate-dependent phosphoglycerate mutase
MYRSDNVPVILIRHAQSEWNRAGRFTGWADPTLTAQGRAEAVAAGQHLHHAGFGFDLAYSSRLRRARETADLVLQQTSTDAVEVIEDWRLNERHYGALQGRDKQRLALEVGEARVWRWRRGYEVRPPAMAATDRRHPLHDPRWLDLPRESLPATESLADTCIRAVRAWHELVMPAVAKRRRVLVASHGNTLRALIMGLTDMSVAEVEGFEIPTGVPIVARVGNDGRLCHWAYLSDGLQRTA